MTMKTGEMDGQSLRDALTDAIRYWERRRLAYNLVLAATVGCAVALRWPHSRSLLQFTSLLPLFVLAMIANICYTSCYAVDVPVQLSGFRAIWQKRRWLLWCLGTLFAAVLAFYWMADEVIGGS
jgi:hypothetical protein